MCGTTLDVARGRSHIDCFTYLRIGLFSDANVRFGARLHQLPVSCDSTSHVPERVDFYIVKLGINKLPNRPIAVSHYKIQTSVKRAWKASAIQQDQWRRRYRDDNYVVQLVFPATSEWIKLELHIGIYKHILVIQIDDAASIHSEAI